MGICPVAINAANELDAAIAMQMACAHGASCCWRVSTEEGAVIVACSHSRMPPPG